MSHLEEPGIWAKCSGIGKSQKHRRQVKHLSRGSGGSTCVGVRGKRRQAHLISEGACPTPERRRGSPACDQEQQSAGPGGGDRGARAR